MEQVILSVEYEGRHLNVWKDNTQGYSRFYVTPLCILNTSLTTCIKDEYSDEHRHIFRFYVKLWDSSVAKTIQLALKHKNITAKASDILPLPMQMVRLGLGPDVTSQIYSSHHWRSHQDQPNILMFELYTRHESFCNKMLSDAKENVQTFLANTKLYFEFTMVVQQRAARNLNITGKTLIKSSTFSNLVNHYRMVYLTSKDMNTLARSILNVVAVEEEVTSNYIASEQEKQIIQELLGIFGEHKYNSNDLTKDEWNSVFWDDIFSRPDIQSEYSNDVLKYDETQNEFKYNATKDREFREKLENRKNTQRQGGKSKGFGFNWGAFGKN
uniref:Uncharacterized protein n=1 Tax=Panagrolaimus davidi TaxID=227884 RepID=A0A914Q9M9_9BILA